MPCADTSWAGPSGLAAHQSVGGKGVVIRSPHFPPRGTKRRVARSALGILGGASPLKPRGQGSPATVFVACSHPRPRSRGCPALADTLWSSVRALRPAARSFCRPVEQLRLRALAAPHSPGSAPPRGSHASGQVPLWWLLRARETDAGGAATAGWVAGLWTAHSGQALASVEVRPRVSISALPGRGTVWQTPSPGPRICLGTQGCSSGARLPGSEL